MPDTNLILGNRRFLNLAKAILSLVLLALKVIQLILEFFKQSISSANVLNGSR